MHRMPGRPDPAIQQLTTRVAKLQKDVDQLLKCVQVTKAQGLSLKGGMKVTIDAGGKLNLKSAATLQLKAGFIHLNPPSGQTPAAAQTAARTVVTQLTKDPAVKKALTAVNPSLLT